MVKESKEELAVQPWMIWDIERMREERERENEAARGLYLPLPLPPPGWEIEKKESE
jgi:hypothetical protein